MQYRISYIVYVYNAEDTIERCVESLLYGEEQDIEIILSEDASRDRSRMICRKLAENSDRITCISNGKYRGEAYARNQALKLARGRYVIFIESKDWVCREYGSLFCDAADRNPENLVASGFRTTPGLFGYEKDWLFNGGEKQCLESGDYFELAGQELLQNLWNKIFRLEVIKTHSLQFEEELARTSDLHFLVDYIRAARCRKFIFLNSPLYICTVSMEPVFDGHKSFVEFAEESEEYRRLADFLLEVPGANNEQYAYALDRLRKKYVHRIMCDNGMSGREKMDCLKNMLKDGRALKHYLKGMKGAFVENLRRRKREISREREKRRKKRQKVLNVRIINKAYEELKTENFTIISQNCIGGVFYHDMGLQFQSPTINLFFEAPDFLKFVSNLHRYTEKQLVMYWGKDYPIGELGDIKVHFMHYSTCREAQNDWARRKERIDYDRIVILATDRDGFSDEEFKRWKALPYKKVLFTVNAQYREEKGVIYYPEYKKCGSIPDLIFAREFYKDGILISEVNQI